MRIYIPWAKHYAINVGYADEQNTVREMQRPPNLSEKPVPLSHWTKWLKAIASRGNFKHAGHFWRHFCFRELLSVHILPERVSTVVARNTASRMNGRTLSPSWLSCSWISYLTLLSFGYYNCAGTTFCNCPPPPRLLIDLLGGTNEGFQVWT